jgi:hypothetical protein
MKRGMRRQEQVAYQNAERLGPIIPAMVTGRREDGSPLLGEGQVYVFPAGLKYHPMWCDVVGHRWDTKPKAVLVTRLEDVGKREECQNCRGGL